MSYELILRPRAAGHSHESSASRQRRIAIIGGGISGLAAAHRINELDPTAAVTLFEASGWLGGVLQTVHREGWLIERSADMFTTREPWALDLCRRVGIADELIETDARYRRAFVVRRGRLVPVPDGFTLMSPAKIWPIVTTPLLSPLGKLRMAGEYLLPPKRDQADESLQSFVVRRFGREAFDRLIQPLIGGIYTADPARLSMAATLPQFVEMEQKWGSLIRAMRVQGRRTGVSPVRTGDRGQETGHTGQETGHSEQGTGARYGMFVAPRAGMQRLIDAVAARLPAGCVRLNTPIERVEQRGATWSVTVRGSATPESFDGIIIATPGAVSSRLLAGVDPALAALISRVEYAGCSVAVLGIRRDQVAHPLDGFGFIVPAIEQRRIIAGSLASVKFPGRAPEGKVLLRVFVGGALQPDLADLPEGEMRRMVLSELAELIGLSGEPEFFEVVRWLGMMPQYHVGHLDLVQQIDERAAAISRFALAGNAYRGVGIPLCVKSGELAAERIVAPSASRSYGQAPAES